MAIVAVQFNLDVKIATAKIGPNDARREFDVSRGER